MFLRAVIRPRGETRHLNADFWKFWTGQVISVMGTSFTGFAIPLLMFQLTHSAVNLALVMAAAMLPYLLFGLIIGAWVDRLDRKRMMIVVDIAMAAAVGSIPFMSGIGHLSAWWIYGAIFVEQTFFIFFSSGEFAAIPSLVGKDDLVTANGRIQASFFASTVIGPLLAGALTSFLPVTSLLIIDAASFLVSAVALVLVRRSFNRPSGEPRKPSTIRQDVVEGLRYVVKHPVLRNISAMMALYNFVGTTTGAQLVLFAKEHLHASNSQIGLLFAVSGAGAVLFSANAGRLRRRWSFSTVALSSLAIAGMFTLAFALSPWFWVSVVLWGLESGVASLFNIQTNSLRQAIVPNHLLGRIMSIAGVLAWSAIPMGSLLGGLAIEATGNVALVYAVIGVFTILIPVAFSFTALGHAERYVPKEAALPEGEPPEDAASVQAETGVASA